MRLLQQRRHREQALDFGIGERPVAAVAIQVDRECAAVQRRIEEAQAVFEADAVVDLAPPGRHADVGRREAQRHQRQRLVTQMLGQPRGLVLPPEAVAVQREALRRDVGDVGCRKAFDQLRRRNAFAWTRDVLDQREVIHRHDRVDERQQLCARLRAGRRFEQTRDRRGLHRRGAGPGRDLPSLHAKNGRCPHRLDARGFHASAGRLVRAWAS
jgi:hypothetical protein